MAAASVLAGAIAACLVEHAPRDRGMEFVMMALQSKVQANDVSRNASLVQAVLKASPGKTPGVHTLCQAIEKVHLTLDIVPTADKLQFESWCMLQAWQLRRPPL